MQSKLAQERKLNQNFLNTIQSLTKELDGAIAKIQRLEEQQILSAKPTHEVAIPPLPEIKRKKSLNPLGQARTSL